MNSLATRLFAAFLAIILLVIAIVSLALILLLRSNPLVQRAGLSRLHALAQTAAEQGLPPGGLGGSAAAAWVSELAASTNTRVLLTNAAGQVLADSGDGQAPALNFLRFRSARRDPAYPDTLIGQLRDRRWQQWLYVARPLGGQRLLVLAVPPERWAVLGFFRENLLWPLFQSAAFAIGVAALLAVVITRSVARPLQQMAAVAQGVAHGRYEQAARVSGPDEVRALGAAINSMASQVQANQQAQRDFLANVSHELKTPLTSIQGFAQALLEGAVTTPDGTHRAATIIHTEAERLGRMVASLLDLARLNPRLRENAWSMLDLPALLAAQVEKFGLRAAAADITLTAALPPTLPAVMGDADRLAQVFGNLLDNALTHTPAGGRVTLSAAPASATVEVTVTDTGSGIPAGDLNRIFERFYQVDKSRVHGGGVGLGLAITKEIVEAHGGTVRAESEPGQGARLVVVLPTA